MTMRDPALGKRLHSVLEATRNGAVERVFLWRTKKIVLRGPKGIGHKAIAQARAAGLIEDGACRSALSSYWTQQLTAAGRAALAHGEQLQPDGETA